MSEFWGTYYLTTARPERGDAGMNRNVGFKPSSERHSRTTADDEHTKTHVLRGTGMTRSREAQSTDFFASLADQPAWMGDGVCSSTDPELFFPDQGGHWQSAKRVCQACPVREQCLDFALEHGERGIWGGTSDRDRLRIRRDMREAS